MQVSSREALRAMAHPLRMKLLLHLEDTGHGRAADLAQALGEPANAVSFHLRTLAKAGLIVEAPELARDKRDRVWRPAADGYDIAPGTPGTEALMRQYVSWFRAVVSRRTAVADTTDDTTDDAAGNDSVHARVTQGYLTADEARELGAELAAVMERWAARMVASRTTAPSSPREAYTIVTAVGPSSLPGPTRPSGPTRPPGPTNPPGGPAAD
jgi:DNA-binding transcriptional ArsR family regulator